MKHKTIPTHRRDAVMRLMTELDRHQIRYIIQTLFDLEGYSIVVFDDEEKPCISVVIHRGSYGTDQDLFETAVLGDDGQMKSVDVTGWQTVDEVIDTIQSAR